MPHRRHPYIYELRFAPLIAFIAAQEGDALTLTFAEIETITGRPLSVTGQTSPSLWIDGSLRFVREFTALGWRAHLVVPAHAVEFRRTH
jgi:hypothetical protein